MAETSGIAWTHSTFNPWLGCSKVSEACRYCYAEVNRAVAGASARVGLPLWGPDAARVVTSDAYWRAPIRWNKDAEQAGERRRVFCASLADVFEDRRDLDAPRARLWKLIEETPWLDWLLLTKRPENVERLGSGWFYTATHPTNVWFGTTAEDQANLERRGELLARHIDFEPGWAGTPKTRAIRFLSLEPLLGPIVLSKKILERISWVIVGGESGKNARPMHPDWVRALRDQCRAAGVAFFFKQWGEWTPAEGRGQLPASLPIGVVTPDGELIEFADRRSSDDAVVVKLGKKVAGFQLDGAIHQEFPCRS